VGLLSAVLNILLLGSSIYMLLVYDSVIPSQSLPTLFSLFAMVIAVYAFHGAFDVLRGRLLADIGAEMDREISPRLRETTDHIALQSGQERDLDPIRDFDQIRSYVASPALAALMDMPWIFFYLALLTLLHYWLGLTTLVGALVMLSLAWVSDRQSRQPVEVVNHLTNHRRTLLDEKRRHAHLARALGMQERLWQRWSRANRQVLAAQGSLVRSTGTLGAAARTFRLALQSAVLTVGALLVIDGNATGGIIFASSILSSRALAPIDHAIGNWRNLVAVRSAWHRLEQIFAASPPPEPIVTSLPPPEDEIVATQVAVAPPGVQRVIAQQISFRLSGGQAMCIVGPSAAGKSSLARVIANIWPPLRGSLTLDGAAMGQWEADVLGRHIGYLPQSVELLSGTIAENIGRFESPADSAAVITAAKTAGVHDMIVAMPQGYDTPVGSDGENLSGGQRQRIGLARALYRDPFIVVLDEPDSNLDASGEAALDAAIASICRRKGIAVIVAHRISAISRCTHALVLNNGAMASFGPIDQIIKRRPAVPAPAPSVAESGKDGE
jgi:type I secretion system ABC transporter, PrtD family